MIRCVFRVLIYFSALQALLKRGWRRNDASEAHLRSEREERSSPAQVGDHTPPPTERSSLCWGKNKLSFKLPLNMDSNEWSFIFHYKLLINATLLKEPVPNRLGLLLCCWYDNFINRLVKFAGKTSSTFSLCLCFRFWKYK